MWKRLIDDVTKVFNEDAFVNLVIKERIDNIKEEEKKLYTKILYGVVENKKWLDFLLKPYVAGRRFKPFYKNALRIGIYAISYLNVPNHYIVNSIVEVVKKKDFKGSKAINFILRNYDLDKREIKAQEEIEKLNTEEKESIIYNIDLEVLRLIKKDYPNDYHNILKNEEENYNIYRINLLKCKIEDVTNYLDKEEIKYEVEEEKLITKSNLIHTVLFSDAWIIPQDSSSMKVAKVMAPKEGAEILDTCAAPGSKSFHLAMLMKNTGSILSCDIYPHKVKLILDEAHRQGITNIKAIVADASNFDYGKSYEYVLCDAPCSGMGTMKHKGDLKLKLTIEKINEIVSLQEKILDNVSKYVMEKGILVYSTCTINKDENEKQIEKFINKHNEFKVIEEISLLPTAMNDGFYICKMKKGLTHE